MERLVSAFGFKVATFCIWLQPKKLQLFEEEALQLYAVQYREADWFVSQKWVFSIVFCGGISHVQGRFPMCRMMGLTNDKFITRKSPQNRPFAGSDTSRAATAFLCTAGKRSVRFSAPLSLAMGFPILPPKACCREPVRPLWCRMHDRK